LNVSALIPTYNRRSHLTHAIDSILGQTVPVDEVIVVDDGSTDGTASAIQNRYGMRERVVRQANVGVARARQRAVEESRGEWIAFLDRDDLWRPTKLERQFRALATL
jgi:glycosyltransferase involved in cell wall biosynthesis